VALFHTRKAEASDFVETVQGTFGTAAAADTIIVVKRARGQADATLHITGRDVVEQELALRFAPEAGTWSLLGDAAEYSLSETRREILEAVRAHGSLTPKQVSDVTGVDYENAKKTMRRMFGDGQLTADRGRYSLKTPVPGVPLSLVVEASGTEGQEGQGSEGSETPPETGAEQLPLALPSPPPAPREWRARDGRWRSLESDPPAFPGEVIDTREGAVGGEAGAPDATGSTPEERRHGD
jgi:hypothetical protein